MTSTQIGPDMNDDWPYDEPGRVEIALISESPWPDIDRVCDSGDQEHEARWVVWTNVDTGDGFRLACDEHLAAWVVAVARRLWDW